MVRIRDGFPGQRLLVMPGEVIARSSTLPVVRDLYVTDIGHFPKTRHHHVARPHGSDNHILIYCAAGRGWCRMGRRRIEIPQETALFIEPGQTHVYGADEDTPWMIYWIHFNGPHAGSYRQVLGVTDETPAVYVPNATAIIDAFEDAYHWLDGGYSDDVLLALSAGMARILSLINLYRRTSNPRTPAAVEVRILRAVAAMRKHLDRPQTLDGLAREAGLSIAHFSHLFRKQTGESPMRFLLHMRMQRACEMLDHTHAPVNEISRRVGYEDSFYFCRQFKKTVGVPPSRYRVLARERMASPTVA